MPRIKHIKKARKSSRDRNCRICAHTVQPGESYKFLAKRTGPRSSTKYFYCKDHHPRPSHMLSGRTAELTEMVEGFDDSINEGIAIRESLESFNADLESFIDDVQNGASSIEEYFGQTEQSSAMDDAAEQLRNWLEELHDIENSLPEDDEIEDGIVSQVQDLISSQPDVNFTA